jgi:hypothetical protein
LTRLQHCRRSKTKDTEDLAQATREDRIDPQINREDDPGSFHLLKQSPEIPVRNPTFLRNDVKLSPSHNTAISSSDRDPVATAEKRI